MKRAPASVPKVLMSCDMVGGVWFYSLDLAEAYAKLGIATTLAVFGPVDADRRAQARASGGVSIVETGATLDWLAVTPDESRLAADVMAQLSADLAPDVVHLNAPSLAAEELSAPAVGVCHSCLDSWWRTVRGGPPPEDFAWRTEELRAGLRHCDVLIAPSLAFAQTTAAAHGVPLPFVVHNGRRRAFLASPARPGELVFAAGRLWDEGKNIATLDAAAALIDIDVVAAGELDGPQRQRTPLENARPLGRLSADAMAHWLARRPMFVSCAVYEPFGLAPLEAAQAGCPLVLSDIPTHRELWNGAALFFEPRNARALAALLSRLAADPEGAAALGAGAQARADAYSVEAMAEGTLAVYAAVAPAFAGFLRNAV